MKLIKKFFIFLALFTIVFSCARRGNPTGGEKDETAPIMVVANPPHKTINFDKNAIHIEFDEFIKLKDVNKQLIISPPLKNRPVITPTGTASKYINIKLNDTLLTNTTYTFNFGNSIEDNNEGNKLERFKYVFSTGNYIDSLTFKGNVLDAFKRDSLKNISVLLYEVNEKFNDSTIYKEKPTYVANTLDSIHYSFSNLKKGKYLVIALEDESNNYLFNPKSDKIGFNTEYITLPQDSVLKDPIKLFFEKQPFKLSKPKEETKGKIVFGYSGEKNDLNIKLLSKVDTSFFSSIIPEQEKDSLNYFWSSNKKIDSLQFEVSNKNFIDTVIVKLRKKKLDSLKFTSNISSILHLNDSLLISTNNPILNIDSGKISLLDKDTVEVSYKLIKNRENQLYLSFDKKQNESYKLQFFPNSITDIFKFKNDTLTYNFSTKSIEDYGTISLDLNNKNNSSLIIQLLNKKGKIKQIKFVKTSQTIVFDKLPPATYLFRFIIDENKNNEWDTGNFLLKKQAEKVIYYPEEINLRANWDVKQSFTIK